MKNRGHVLMLSIHASVYCKLLINERFNLHVEHYILYHPQYNTYVPYFIIFEQATHSCLNKIVQKIYNF
jgi:hypothetical protein